MEFKELEGAYLQFRKAASEVSGDTNKIVHGQALLYAGIVQQVDLLGKILKELELANGKITQKAK